jgi:tetratricopeptide (TPR) repeat protein
MAQQNESVPTAEEVRRQLARMLSGEHFTSNENPAKFLALVVELALQNKPITQSVIGTELFHDKYAKKDISDVRVTANSLRKVLSEYYAQEGFEDRVIISLPPAPLNNKLKLPAGKAYKPLFKHNPRNNAVVLYATGCHRASLFELTQEQDALADFDKAIKEEPAYAAAYVAKAELALRWAIYGGWANYYSRSPKNCKECLIWAEELVQTALKYDCTQWRGHSVLGAVHFCLHQWDTASRDFAKALEINPLEARNSWYYVMYLLILGKKSEAWEIIAARTAETQHDDIEQTFRRCFYYLIRSFDSALGGPSFHSMSVEAHRGISSLAFIQACLALDDPKKALDDTGIYPVYGTSYRAPFAAIKRVKLLSGLLILCYVRVGKKKLALEEYKSSKPPVEPSPSFVLAYMALGQFDKAIDQLSVAWDNYEPLTLLLEMWAIFDPLRSHFRFQELIRRMDLPSVKRRR